MKSIKPGRGPSLMSGVAGIFVALFGVIWTVSAISMGAPAFFALFGVIFVIMAVIQSLYNLKNGTSKNRYSMLDITEDGEEPDPLEKRFETEEKKPVSDIRQYCPYCGKKLQDSYEYCPYCGKKI